SFLATLGFGSESLWDSRERRDFRKAVGLDGRRPCSLAIGHWSLVVLLFLNAQLPVRADDTNNLNPAIAETNSALVKPADANSPAAAPLAPATNALPLRALDTNSVFLTPI